MTYDIEQCAKRIRLLRVQKGYTQEKLADTMKIDRNYYWRIETGRRPCSIELLIQLSDFFDVSLDYLVLGRYKKDQSEKFDMKEMKSDIERLMAMLELLKAML